MNLRKMHAIGLQLPFKATVGFRADLKKNSKEKVLVDVRDDAGLLESIDHIIMIVGQEIPYNADIIAMFVPGVSLRFIGKAYEYMRSDRKTKDYSLKLVRILSAVREDTDEVFV